jgi:hypothetical protein
MDANPAVLQKVLGFVPTSTRGPEVTQQTRREEIDESCDGAGVCLLVTRHEAR